MVSSSRAAPVGRGAPERQRRSLETTAPRADSCDSFPLVDNAILASVGPGNCRWSGLGFSHDQHPARHRGRTRRARPRRVRGAGRGRRRAADRGPEEARLLALAVHWVDLHPVTDGAPGRDLPDPTGGWAGLGAGSGLLRPGTAGRGRDAGGGRVRGGGARGGAEPLAHRGPGAGVGGGRALLPAPAPVGAGPGRPAAGVEGPPGRQGHHPAVPGRGGVRGPAPRGHRPVATGCRR